MVNTVIIILYALVVLIAVLLTCLILIQPSKSGGGLGASFGGGVGESVFGAHAASHLTKLTVIMITIFFVVVLALAVVSGHANKTPKSIIQLETAPAASAQKMPTAPVTAEAAPVVEKASVPAPEKEVAAPTAPVVPAAPATPASEPSKN